MWKLIAVFCVFVKSINCCAIPYTIHETSSTSSHESNSNTDHVTSPSSSSDSSSSSFEQCSIPSGLDLRNDVEPRVFGGIGARIAQFPFYASIRLETSNVKCGGFIITNRWIGTAAHCFRSKVITTEYVVVGTNEMSLVGTPYALEKLSATNWNDEMRTHDVILAKTSFPIEFNFLVSPIALSDETVDGGVKGVVIGYGGQNYLHWAELKVITNDQCKAILPDSDDRYIYDGALCTYSKPEKGTCPGDSGSPLVLNGKVIGIVSWGENCDNCPDVFTRISTHKQWMEQQIAIN